MSADFLDAYEDNVWSVYAYLAYRTSTPEAAEDLTQVTFERALKAWPRFDPGRASARTWLLTIARNAMIDAVRRSRPQVSADLADERMHGLKELSVPGPEQSLGGLSPELESALARLQPREREVLALRYGGDLNASEIAGLMELSVANVHQISSRSLRKLRAELLARRDDVVSGGEPAPGGPTQRSDRADPERSEHADEQ